ncbi:amino acid adenylation domain-containing protein [Desulforamulus ruminis]|uniref:non-ribosomal peptide synthetase/type I polyketide synthase n=1 Tax=Desulforamulus ruminis TaxID=1564 RepID=UPI002FD8EDE1
MNNIVPSVDGIAVIGMSCRFPGAKTIQEFWENLCNGAESVTFFNDQELLEAGVPKSFIKDPHYVKAGCVIDGIDLFDHKFFGYSPKEAGMMDPQQRLFMECAWESFEDAGYVPQNYPGRVGVFGGMRISTYLQNMLPDFNRTGTAASFQALIGTDKDYLASRVSYKFNLKGPSITVQTACSTSLVAVHLACESLRSGECDMALAGGVALSVPQRQGYFFQEDMIFSPDGHCRAFDADAQGIIGGNGAGVVLLKPLAEALADKDPIYAVIKGSSVNNDGMAKAGYTAPSIEGQTLVVSEALAMADIRAGEISYVETHGTGTPLGDPMEIEALTRVFRADTGEKNFCAVGSVKTNIGHLDTAAGIASFIKTVLALKHKQIPPSLHFNKPNPKIDFARSPFFVNTSLRPWAGGDKPLTAGVSSFGIGGTNAHVVVQESPVFLSPEKEDESPEQLLVLSALNEKVLQKQAGNMKDFLNSNPAVSLRDAGYTLAEGRAHFSCRLAVRARSRAQALSNLEAFLEGTPVPGVFSGAGDSGSPPAVVFLFSGQGSQYQGMGRVLYDTQPVFREALTRCARILEDYLDKPLLQIIFDEGAQLNQTRYTQPALFAIEYALARMWQSWGVVPAAVMGHSVGEYVAACLAGIFSLEDGLRLIAARARLMQELPENGSMVAVFTGAQEIAEVAAPYEQTVSIAAFNGPNLVVLSGATEAVEDIVGILGQKGVESHKLTVSHAFHSSLMAPVLPEFMAEARQVNYHAPRITLVSNCSGMAAGSEMSTPDYWGEHILKPVRFADSIKTLEQEGYRVFLEIGPHAVLTGMARGCAREACEFIPTLRREREPWDCVMDALGRLYAAGVDIQWKEFYRDDPGRRISLPTYPFDRKRHWIDPREPEKAKEKDADSGMEDFWTGLVAAGRRQARISEPEENLLRSCREEQELLERLCGHYLSRAFKELGAFEDPEDRFTVETFLFQTPVMPRYGQWLGWLLEGMAQRGLLEKSPEGYQNLVTMGEDEVHNLLARLQESSLFSENRELLQEIQDYGEKLAEILEGSSTDSPFFSLMEALFRDFPGSRYYNGIVKALAENTARSVPEEYQLRVLEIGGGTGELAETLLEVLPAARTEYTFTDLGDLMVEYAKEKLGTPSCLKYQRLDIQENPQEQGLGKHRYDVVLAGNVLHGVRDLGKALGHIRWLLAPGGLLMIRERTSHNLLFDLLLGADLTEIEDEESRGGIFPRVETWREILEKQGFEWVETVEEGLLGEYILLARTPQEASRKDDAAFSFPVKKQAEDARALLGEEHSLLGRGYNTALPVYERTLRVSSPGFTRDYQVLGKPMAPVSDYCLAAYAAGEAVLGSRELQIEGLELFDPLVFLSGDEVRTGQFMITEKTAADLSFKYFSRPLAGNEPAADWSLNFSGRVRESPGYGSGMEEVPASGDNLAGVSDEIRKDSFYNGFAGKGIQYGNGLQIIQQLVKEESGAMAAVRLPEPENPDLQVFSRQAQISEACLQVALALAQDAFGAGKENQGLYFPTRIEKIAVASLLPPELFIQAVLHQGDKNSFRVDCRLYDPDNRPLGEVTGMGLTFFALREVERIINRKEPSLTVEEGPEVFEAGLSGPGDALRETLGQADPEERHHLLENYLLEVFARILRMDQGEISPEDDFIQLGLDSLLFLELNQTLARDLRIRITAQEAFETPYIRALVERLTVELGNSQEGDRSSGGDRPEPLDPVEAIGGPITADGTNRYEPFNLTNVQYAYWIGRSGILDLGNVSCHFYFEVERDELDAQSFNRAWNKVVERHDMLRSIILPEGKQQILKSVPLYEIVENDFTHRTPEEAEVLLNEIRHQMSHQVISSDCWPLFDIRVSFLPGGRVRMHFSIELLNADVMSIQIIFSEIDRFLKDPQYNPKPLEISFRDYVLAENALRETEFYQKSRDYWLERIPQMPPAPQLPLAKSLSEVGHQRFSSIVFELDHSTWNSLKKKAARRGLTPSGVLLAAYADILAAWSGNCQFIVSLAQFNRIPFHPDVYNITGDFTSIMIMPMDTGQGASFLERAKGVQADLWNHLEHRYFDGVEVIREMARGKRVGSEALIPVVFTSILGMGEQSEELYPWAVLGEVGYFVSQTPQVWLDNQVSERNGCLIVSWDVIEELFPPGMLKDMLTAYEKLLIRLALEEEAWEEREQSLVPEEHRALYDRVNDTAGPVSPEMLHTLFTASASRHPERVAVIAPGRSLSYGELQGRANHVAHLLRDQGARPNTLVAVVMEKGWEQIVAVLGIILSGAAYLPVSADMPEERINNLLADGEVSLVLTQSRLAAKLSAWPDFIRSFAVDTMELTERDQRPPEGINKPEDIAYVIYTSGSTGRPKGVVIDHRGAVNTLLDINQRFGVGPEDRVLALSSLSFDLSVYDIFGLLAAGGAIVLPEAERAKDPAHWWELMEKESVTLWNSVPLMMQMLVEDHSGLRENPLPSLRLVLLSGDWIPPALPGRIGDLFPGARVISLGGATEASIWSILYPIREVPPEWKSIPYGKPMLNQHFYVLDRNLNECPPWVPGRLYIGGIGLAKGYWRDQEKTAGSFLNHPRTGERIYFTGDLGRYLPDGNIEFLGRDDFQVKIRGYRIELGEIEALLQEHPGVRNAVVNVVGEAPGEKKLYAYVVSDKNEALFKTETVNEAEAMGLWEGIKETGRGQAQIPPYLSPGTFPAFWNYMEQLAAAIIKQVLRDLGAFAGWWEKYSPEQLAEKLGIEPRYRNLLEQWLHLLVREKELLKDENDLFSNPKPFPAEALQEALLEEINAYPVWRERAVKLLEYSRSTRPVYGALLSGKVDPLELFLAEDSMFTAKAMEQFNPVRFYGTGILVSITGFLAGFLQAQKSCRVLEIGSRADSLTKEILPLLSPGNITYTYADSSAFFLDKTREELADHPAVEYRLFDFNKDPQAQDMEAHHYDVILAPNTLHRAQHIGTSLGYVRQLLAAGGLLLLYEGTRNSSLQLVTVGLFEDGFSHFQDQRRESCLPLLTAEQWREALSSGGFEAIASFPEAGADTEVFGQSVLVARAPLSVTRFSPQGLQDYLAGKMPEYMVPAGFMHLEELPLSANGKIDRKALPQPEELFRQQPKLGYEEPGTETEKRVARLWKKILRTDRPGIHDDFIIMGGDSLQATQLVNLLRDAFRMDIPLRIIFEEASIHKLARYIDQQKSVREETFEEGSL